MLILGVDQHSTCKGSGRITLDNVDPGGIDRHSTWKGSTKTLEGSPLTMLILGALQLKRISEDFGRITLNNVDLEGES